MASYLIRRVLWAVVLFLAVTIVTYVIFFVTPADPARLAAGQGATPADVAARSPSSLHLDEPVWKQYGLFLKQLVVEQSLGESFVNRQDVNDIVSRAAPVTASLVFGGAIFWLLLSIPIGILSALRPRSLIDRAGMVFVLDRDLGAPGLDRAHLRLLLRLQARADADHRLLRLHQPVARASAAVPCSGPTT